jgi:hypothetical protein
MNNKNPLLVPVLREMLAAGDSRTLKDFCESGHPTFPRHRMSTPEILRLPARVVFASSAAPADQKRGQNRNPRVRRVAPRKRRSSRDSRSGPVFNCPKPNL